MAAAKTPPIHYAANSPHDQQSYSSSLGTAAAVSNGNTAYNYPTASSSSVVHQHFPDFQHPHSFSYNSTDHDNDHVHDGHLYAPAPTRPTGKFTEEWDASQRGSSIINGPIPRINNMSSIQRSNSSAGGSITGGAGSGPSGATMDGSSSIQVSRSNTLKKKNSMRRSSSLRRAGSRRSMKAGSVRSLALQSSADEDEMHNAFYCPVPTSGNPTEALANRFQSWRKVLKDLITYFKEIQTHYEARSKSLVKLANVLNNVHMPPGFLPSGGLDDAVQVLRNYNSQAIMESNKAREIEEDVILALTGLRSDLQLKIKEIKNLSGDFKNSVEKEMEVTRRAVRTLQEALGKSDLDSALTTGKEDPYLLRLAVDRQLERQLDEENYLHQAYLNLENSGRELESIVVGEIQKSYNAYAGILKRESDAAYYAIEELRVGPIAMPKDHEWINFVQKDDQFVDPNIPIRSPQYIHYPGKSHYACQEIRAGLLERKTKYLKSYTAGWYVLSPTHLHEFKSADKTQSPVMSLYLPEQKLGSHSLESGSSPKFILKGRQTGGVHRGHSWVFRAESYDTMMAWYEDIKALTEKTPQERSEFVRSHSRSISRTSSRRSVSSDGVVDEDDDEPYSAHNSAAALTGPPNQHPGFQQQDGSVLARRPSPGGRFPSDIEVNAQRGLQAPLSPSSLNDHAATFQAPPQQQPRQPQNDQDVIAAAGALPGSSFEHYYPQQQQMSPPQQNGYATTSATMFQQAPSQEIPNGNGNNGTMMNTYNSTYQQQHNNNTAPYANHPAVLIAQRQRLAAENGDDFFQRGQQQQQQRDNYQEGSWMTGSPPVEAASIPVDHTQGQKTSQPQVMDGGLYVTSPGARTVEHSYATAAPTSPTNYRELPRTTQTSGYPPHEQMTNGNGSVLGAGVGSRPAMSERTESDAPTLSSEVPTISHLHVPGEYPKMNMI